MELHLISCPVCRARLEQLKWCSQTLKSTQGTESAPAIPDLDGAKDRVWQRMARLETAHWGCKTRPNLWQRRLSIPLPAAAAAVAVAVLAVVFTVSRQSGGSPSPEPIPTGEMTAVQGIIPASDMNEVLQYLEREDMTDIVIIRLPEMRSFSSSGEPTMLRAADYTRRTRSP
jgi:hypothetical protein